MSKRIYEVAEGVSLNWSSVLTVFYNSNVDLDIVKRYLIRDNNPFIRHYKRTIVTILSYIMKNKKTDEYTHIIFRGDSGIAFVLKNADRENTLTGKKLVVDLDAIKTNYDPCTIFMICGLISVCIIQAYVYYQTDYILV